MTGIEFLLHLCSFVASDILEFGSVAVDLRNNWKDSDGFKDEPNQTAFFILLVGILWDCR